MHLKRKRVLLYELMIVVTIISSSFMTYLHVLCPDTSTWTTFFFQFNSTHYNSAQMYCFFVLLFLSQSLLLSLWYITCRYWWKIAIFIVLMMSFYNFSIVVFSEVESSDLTHRFSIYFLTLLCSYLVYLVSKKINYPLWNRLTLDAIDSEEVLRYKFKNSKHYTRVLNSFDEDAYKSNITNLKELVAKAVLISEDNFNKEENQSNILDKSLKGKSIGGVLIFLLILSLLLLDKLHVFAPDDKTWDLGFITMGSFEFQSVFIFLWFTMLKITSFLALTIWFLTSRYWWKYFLLIPIIIVSYQIIGTFNVNVRFINENEIMQALPLLLPVMLFLIFLSIKINNFTKVEKLKNKIKVKTFKVISFLAHQEDEEGNNQIKVDLARLMESKSAYKADDYLKELEVLHKKLLQKKRSQ